MRTTEANQPVPLSKRFAVSTYALPAIGVFFLVRLIQFSEVYNATSGWALTSSTGVPLGTVRSEASSSGSEASTSSVNAVDVILTDSFESTASRKHRDP